MPSNWESTRALGNKTAVIPNVRVLFDGVAKVRAASTTKVKSTNPFVQNQRFQEGNNNHEMHNIDSNGMVPTVRESEPTISLPFMFVEMNNLNRVISSR